MSSTEIAGIKAVVTVEREKVTGGVPVFIADSNEESAKIAFYLENILDATVHDLKNGVYILVKH